MIKKNASNKPLPPREDGTSAPPKRLATVREACTYGRLDHTRCYDLISQGKVTAYKRGRQTMIDLDSIDAMHAQLSRKLEGHAGCPARYLSRLAGFRGRRRSSHRAVMRSTTKHPKPSRGKSGPGQS